MICKARGMSSVIGRLYSEGQEKRLHVCFLKSIEFQCTVLEARTLAKFSMFVDLKI
jgi:hypothetical protein